ncbi:MAG: RNA polymerase sigma factor [Acidimicrobiia bacterium]
MDDRLILRALVDDFDNGFTALVAEHQRGIYSGARRLTNRAEDAEDVAQDTFVRAYRALRSYEEGRIRSLQLRPWLWTIALNLCRNRARAKMIEVELVESDGAGDQSPAIFDSDAWNRRLASLNSGQREAIVLRYVLDLPLAEIAEITGRPVGTVKSDISRALDRLRATMQTEVYLAR